VSNSYGRWSKDDVIRTIRVLKANGEQLNIGHVARHYPALSRAGQHYFGDWGGAIRAAGLDYDKIRRDLSWTRPAIVERILAMKKAGEALNYSDAQSCQFGSWAGAIKAAGLDYSKVKRIKSWSKHIIVSEIKRVRREGMDLSTAVTVRTKYRILHAAAIRHYGSWPAALKAAGLGRCQQSKTRKPKAKS
jgi:hypothetical protein